ncbi:MAG: tetraacyldisaccharide 4'-kinase [Rhodoferax sp.]|uniref:tetraacyldisaccharide 4'-kinase n=1 Tax=Rhodoferax sp. TaxID=50421 RepID=UPI0013FEB5D9|nr:tetraacyldisaccharide 4'-kinase [Rhodoferax sp.]NDP40615.1 tetraacyldisaccharide 4'-kinase [Rhodoferax sp.]
MTQTTQASTWQQRLTRAWTHRGPLAWLLWPISLLFGALVALRRSLYQAGIFKSERVPIPVIVVGNVVAGGAGKTPVVMLLVRHLQARGLQVGVISRGYGRQSDDCREVCANSAIADVGDEPALIRRSTGAPVFVARRRIDAARALLGCYPQTQLIVCDDGLQHLGLQRDLEICVFDERGVGNGFLLPAGPLREPWPRTVGLVLHTGTPPAFAGFCAQRTLSRYALRADGSQQALGDLAGPACLCNKPLLALAAIAKPEDFFAMLRTQGLTLARTLALPDHYDFQSFVRNEYEGFTLICTEKDAVKLWPLQPEALAVPLLVTPEPAFLTQLDARLDRLLATHAKPTLSLPHGHTTT